MATPYKETPRMATWEIVCRHLYGRNEKRKLLCHSRSLANRAIDEIFLVRAMLRILFHTDKDYLDLRDKLRSAGFSDNLVAMPVLLPTWYNIILAHRKAKRVFQDDYYEDEYNNPNCIHHRGKKKRVHADFIGLLELTGVTIKNQKLLRPKVKKERNTIYYATGLLPHDLSPYIRDDAITGIPPLVENPVKADNHESKDHRSLEQHQQQPSNPRTNLGSGAAVKSTPQDNLELDCKTVLHLPSGASPQRKGPRTPCLRVPSWEFICLFLYDENKKREILGYPPFTRQDIDEIFLYRALLNRLFSTWDDCHDLQQRLRSAGFSDDLTAVKGLHQYKRANVIDTLGMPEPQTWAMHSWNTTDGDKNRRRLYDITHASMDARLKRKRAAAVAQLAIQDNYLYPTIQKSGNGRKLCRKFVYQSSHLDSSQRKDAPITSSVPNNVDKTASPNRNTNENWWKPINANIQFWSWFGKTLPSNDGDEGKLPCAATLAQQAFKVPNLRSQYRKKFWIVSVILAALVAHTLFWNLLERTDHRLRGSTKQSTAVRFFLMETGEHPRIHALGKDHGTLPDPNRLLRSLRRM